MTGLLLLILIVAAVVWGLEAHHRRLSQQGPYAPGWFDPDLFQEQRDLPAWR